MVDHIMKMDWSPRSRTSNPCSRSPAAVRRSLDYGECLAAAMGEEAQARRAGPSTAVEDGRIVVPEASRDEPLGGQWSARKRPQTDANPTAARTANGPRPAEGRRNDVGNRFTSAIGLTRVENRRTGAGTNPRTDIGPPQPGTAVREARRAGCGTGGQEREDRPVVQRDQPPHHLQRRPAGGLRKP